MQTSITSWLQKNPKLTPQTDKQLLHRAAQPDDDDNPSFVLDASTIGKSQIPLPDSQAAGKAEITPYLPYSIKHRPLPSNAQVSRVTVELLPQFKRLISVLLPVPYSNAFYAEILSDPVAASLTLVALWREDSDSIKVVSGIRCRLLAQSPVISSSKSVNSSRHEDKSGPCLYIATMATYSPYRSHGLASTMLRRLIKTAGREHGIKTVTAHVWEASSESREWYAKRGFEEVMYEPEYHKRLNPRGAYLVERRVQVSDLLAAADDDTDV